MPYESYIRANILAPAGMTDTGINYLEEVVPNRATGYTKRASGDFTAPLFQVPPASADGGIETTVLDMLKFDRALYGDNLLSEASKEKMFTPNLENWGTVADQTEVLPDSKPSAKRCQTMRPWMSGDHVGG